MAALPLSLQTLSNTASASVQPFWALLMFRHFQHVFRIPVDPKVVPA